RLFKFCWLVHLTPTSLGSIITNVFSSLLIKLLHLSESNSSIQFFQCHFLSCVRKANILTFGTKCAKLISSTLSVLKPLIKSCKDTSLSIYSFDFCCNRLLQ